MKNERVCNLNLIGLLFAQMLKQAKQFLMLCLIVLQFVAPFIHAHAFGHDSFKAQVFHVHADEIGYASGNTKTFSQADISDNQIIGAITTVANGIKTSASDDIVDGIAFMAIFFTLALLSFSACFRFIANANQAFPLRRNLYSLQNPRAPPR
jgi:hypothetical protein